MALPWILIQYGPNGAAGPTNGTIAGPPPWVLISYGTDGAAVAPVVTVGTVGGTRHHGYSSSHGFNKKRWLELLEEIRLEQVALAAPTKAKAALAAVNKAERQAALLAEQLELNEAEQLARTLVAAERASKAVDALKLANQAVRQMAELQARMDEDEEEVLMLLLH